MVDIVCGTYAAEMLPVLSRRTSCFMMMPRSMTLNVKKVRRFELCWIDGYTVDKRNRVWQDSNLIIQKKSTMAGFEPTRGNPSRFRICRLNPSATLSSTLNVLRLSLNENFCISRVICTFNFQHICLCITVQVVPYMSTTSRSGILDLNMTERISLWLAHR